MKTLIKRLTTDFTRNWLPFSDENDLSSRSEGEYNNAELVIEIITWITVVLAVIYF